MNTEKKYLAKKRKKIFSINNFPKNKDNKNKDKSKGKQPQSLINISKIVLDYIIQNNKTTGNKITEYVKFILQANDSDEMTQKNIQRRVYDSINIMSPGNIIKNKQSLEFINYNFIQKENNENTVNFKKEEKNEINNNNSIDDEDRKLNEEEMKEYKTKLKKLKEMQNKLIKRYITLKFYEKYSNNNNKPEINIKENNSIFPIEVIKKENINKFKNNGNFENLNSYKIMKKIIAPDILAKLNNEKNKNIINKDIKKKEETDEIFDYLKNIDLFREEIINSVNISNKRKIINKNKISISKNTNNNMKHKFK